MSDSRIRSCYRCHDDLPHDRMAYCEPCATFILASLKDLNPRNRTKPKEEKPSGDVEW